MKEDLRFIISEKLWPQLVARTSPHEIVQQLSFEEAMFLARDLFFETFQDCPNIRDFAINLFFAIRKYFTLEWDKDWKHDILLADVCQLGYKYKECFDCCMRAYKKFDDPPASLLLELAECYNMPFHHNFKTEDTEALLKRAMQKGGVTYELALMYKGVSIEKDDQASLDYWTKVAEMAKRNNIRRERYTPDLFKDELSSVDPEN